MQQQEEQGLKEIQNARTGQEVLKKGFKLQWNVQGTLIKILLLGDLENLDEFIDFLKENMREYTSGDPESQKIPLVLQGRLHLGTKKLYNVRIEHKNYKDFEETFEKFYKNHSTQYPSSQITYDGILIYWKEGCAFSDYTKASYLIRDRWARSVGYFNPKDTVGDEFQWIFKGDSQEQWETKLRSFIRRTQVYVPGDEAMKPIIESKKELNPEKSSQKPIEKKESQKDLDPEELDRIKKDLEDFLCLKYDYSGIELEEKIEDPIWKKKLSNWDAIKKVLTAKPVPSDFTEKYSGPRDRKPITVILNRDSSENQFSYLKAAAYYPWMLDPVPYYLRYDLDENVMIQLAFATHHGMYLARYHLYLTTGECYPHLPRFHPLSICGDQSVNFYDLYYELPLPEKYWGYWGRGFAEKNIPFDPETDKEKSVAFFDYLLSIIRTGKRPDTITYA